MVAFAQTLLGRAAESSVGATSIALQRARVRLYLLVLLTITTGLYLLVAAARLFLDHHTLRNVLLDPDGVARCGLIVTLAVAYAAVSRESLSRRLLIGFDGGAGALVAVFGLAGIPSLPTAIRPDLTLLLIVALVLAARAALVPSTPERTLVVGLLALLPILAIAPTIYDPSLLVGDIPMRRIARVTTLGFGAASLVVTCLTSHIIYRLRRSIGHAAKLGPYELGRKLGEGGMGCVYEARHALLRRKTALKLIKRTALSDDLVERFEHEARLTSELSHPNTVALYDYGQTPDGVDYYAMELIEGVTLDTLMRAEGALPAARVLSILRQVAASLAQAHSRGLIHRDIKPTNIMLCSREGHGDLAKVLDFGLATRIGGDDRDGDVVVGTPQFMAPEAVFRNAAVGPPADVYAVGTVGYYLLTGTMLFQGNSTASLANAHLHEPPLPPSLRTRNAVSADLEGVLMKCLAKEPSRRYRDGAALLEALERCVQVGWCQRDAEHWWRQWGSGREPARADVDDGRVTLPATRVA